ncbi:MAG: RNA methyltransferase [Oscillospiraceae bacterium]|nr:RNA methyltransferase [Oscillospiraceae bacterium]
MDRKTVVSRQNPLIRHIRRLGADAAYRRESGRCLADGRKLLAEALRSGVSPETVVVTEGAALPELPGADIIAVPEGLMDFISPLEAPQGVLFVCPVPPPPPAPVKGRWLLLDCVQDPGNVGSILRAAEAFGLSGVLLTPGCADPFGPKALRASMGAAFRLPIGKADTALPLIAADMDGEPLSARALPADCAVVLGSEGRGVSLELKTRAERVVSLPMRGKAESLGVAAAAAILCWEMSKP